MRRIRAGLGLVAVAMTAALGACSAEAPTAGDSADISSTAGTPLLFTFEGEVLTTASGAPRAAIHAQLQYVQGILTTQDRANGQTGTPTLEGVTSEPDAATGATKVRYTAKLPVVWPKGRALPETYALPLPRDARRLDAFNAKYDGACGRNEYGQDTFWHDFRPNAPGCVVDDADVTRATATVAPHPQTTSGKFPEYDAVWADDRLDVVAVFGIISSNTPNDEGARTRETILGELERTLPDAKRTEAAPMRGVIAESTVEGSVVVGGDPRTVRFTAILVQEASSAGPAFEAHYEELTAGADLVVYEGHSGLGKNIDVLTRRLGATKGKYQLAYLYGCQTLAYLGPDAFDKRIALNGSEDDPEGTRYLDLVTNALPAYGDAGRSTLGLYFAMLGMDDPASFDTLVKGISSSHLVTVLGEHDNRFTP